MVLHIKGGVILAGGDIGSIIGGLIGAIIGLLIVKLCNKNGKLKSEYDERQELIRMKGYKYAFIGSWVMLGLYVLISYGGVELPFGPITTIAVIGIASLMIHVSYAIWHDSYFGRNNNVKKFIVAFGLILIFDIVTSVISFHQYKATGADVTYKEITFVETQDGFWLSYIASCILLFAALVQCVIKLIIDKKLESKEDTDDEDLEGFDMEED